MNKKWLKGLVFLLLLIFKSTAVHASLPVQTYRTHLVEPGDTWTALQWRYNLPADFLQAINPHPNRQRQPVIGRSLFIPEDALAQDGLLVQSVDSSTLVVALKYDHSPWALALKNNLTSPYLPTLGQPLFLSQENFIPRLLPPGISNLELSASIARPGQAIAVRGRAAVESTVDVYIDSRPLDMWREGNYWVALTGTGAFYGTAQPELKVNVDGHFWSQPWQFQDPDLWDYQQINLTGSAAQIDQAAIAVERERLFAIWNIVTPGAKWNSPFQLPVDEYLELSSDFGARRSYNGGPYASYHEGVDFSAYGGTPVFAPAAGTVVVAENLYVRGGAVVLDHGIGVYTGFYHLSAVHVSRGESVPAGHLLGEVGTTGLSTGNHLHWDLLVDATWVDAWAWYEQDMGCWILSGLGRPCL